MFNRFLSFVAVLVVFCATIFKTNGASNPDEKPIRQEFKLYDFEGTKYFAGKVQRIQSVITEAQRPHVARRPITQLTIDEKYRNFFSNYYRWVAADLVAQLTECSGMVVTQQKASGAIVKCNLPTHFSNDPIKQEIDKHNTVVAKNWEKEAKA